MLAMPSGLGVEATAGALAHSKMSAPRRYPEPQTPFPYFSAHQGSAPLEPALESPTRPSASEQEGSDPVSEW